MQYIGRLQIRLLTSAPLHSQQPHYPPLRTNMKFTLTLAALACIVLQAVSATPLLTDDGTLQRFSFPCL